MRIWRPWLQRWRYGGGALMRTMRMAAQASRGARLGFRDQ
jgi:hypothetical protein